MRLLRGMHSSSCYAPLVPRAASPFPLHALDLWSSADPCPRDFHEYLSRTEAPICFALITATLPRIHPRC